MSKKVSFSERCEIVYPSFDVPKDAIGYPKIIQKVVDGKITQSVEFVVDDNPNEGLTVNDFALENLLAAGVQLKEMSFTNPSLSSVDKLVDNLPTFDDLKN